jgi:hypothetical protein
VQVKILYFSGCPNWQKAAERTRTALVELGRGDVALELEDAQGMAHLPHGWAGSPTVLVDGRDPFAERNLAASRDACRMYRTATGLEGAPGVDELRRALDGD